ncbi:restriction endonuclease subunit S [Mycobacteroides abscessus]|uniref:restriction endonuclease subunit S n=1 Tax=Mycobacteroides abscessus TaxID=36809 RepID=UPI001878AC38|nr:hypothetical protein [Mycobacteroides abscessus]
MSVVSSPRDEVALADLLSDGLFVDGDWVESKDQDPDGDVRLIQLADVGDGVFRDRSSRFLTSEKAKELRCTFLEPGDVLVARMPEPLGRACIFPGVGQPAVTAVDVCIIRPNPKRVQPEWLVAAINSPDFRSAMQQFVRGTTRQRISRKNLGTLELHVPDVAEQLAITDEIGHLESSRGSAADHIAAARRAVERFRQAVLAAACSGRLTADLRAERGIEDGALPGGWQSDTLGVLAESIRGGSTEVPRNEPTAFPILRSSSVRPFVVDYSDVRYLTADQSTRELNYLCDGDLLVTRLSGSLEYVGNCAVVRLDDDQRIQYPDRLFCCRLTDPREAPFVQLVFAGPEIRAQIEAATRSAAGHQRISITDLKRFHFARPPLDEQAEIVRRVEQLLQLADGLKARIDTASKYVDRSSQAVLSKAFRGELVGSGGTS